MELRKTGLVLLALLLAAMVVVPMASAAVYTIYPSSFAREDSSTEHYFGGRGDYSQGGDLYNWEVVVTLINPSGSTVQTEYTSCASGNDCSTGYVWANLPANYPHGQWRVRTQVRADGYTWQEANYYTNW